MIDASYGDSTQLLYLRDRYYNVASGRFQSRDTWGGDYNLPQSLNHWNYTQSNPINYTDPSGNTSAYPYQGDSGYSEGYIDSGVFLFMNLAIDGYEIVYDFQTLERALFHVTKKLDPSVVIAGICSSVINITDMAYTSVIYGFEPEDGLEEDYSGTTRSISGGWSIVGFGVGGIGFVSANRDSGAPTWDVFGYSIYSLPGDSGLYGGYRADYFFFAG